MNDVSTSHYLKNLNSEPFKYIPNRYLYDTATVSLNYDYEPVASNLQAAPLKDHLSYIPFWKDSWHYIYISHKYFHYSAELVGSAWFWFIFWRQVGGGITINRDGTLAGEEYESSYKI